MISEKESKAENENLEIGEEPTADMSVASSHDSLKELIEKNIKWSQVLYHQNKAIKHRITLMVLGGYIRLALILVPIIFGIIYLPPFVADMKARYEAVSSSLNGNVDLSKLLQQFFAPEGGNVKNIPQGRK